MIMKLPFIVLLLCCHIVSGQWDSTSNFLIDSDPKWGDLIQNRIISDTIFLTNKEELRTLDKSSIIVSSDYNTIDSSTIFTLVQSIEQLLVENDSINVFITAYIDQDKEIFSTSHVKVVLEKLRFYLRNSTLSDDNVSLGVIYYNPRILLKYAKEIELKKGISLIVIFDK